MQRVFVGLTGETSDAAIIISTLVIAASFTSLRNWLQARVDRRFKEPRDPGPVLRKLVDEAQRSLARPDPERFARRLLDTAVEVTDARGGEVRLRDGRRSVSVSTAGWADVAAPDLVAPIRSDGREIGRLALAGRESGTPFSRRDAKGIEEAMSRVPEALS